MARITSVTTVPGSRDGIGNRKVAYTLIKDDGAREALTLDVSGDRNRVKAMLSSYHNIPQENIEFDVNYDD